MQAIEVAKKAGAVKACDLPGYDDCYTDQFDEDARKACLRDRHQLLEGRRS
jgi:hypothetical protein